MKASKKEEPEFNLSNKELSLIKQNKRKEESTEVTIFEKRRKKRKKKRILTKRPRGRRHCTNRRSGER